MMVLNQQMIVPTMWTSGATVTGIGAVSVIEGGLSIYSYVLATVPVLVLLTMAVVKYRFDRREDARKQALFLKEMGETEGNDQ